MAKILLVEDDLPLMRLYEGALAPEYEVIAVDSTARALAVMEADIPDVVILDLNLPDAPGTTILQYIEAQATFSATRVVIMTGFAHHYQRDHMSGNVVEVLHKPVTTSMLLRVVKSAITVGQG